MNRPSEDPNKPEDSYEDDCGYDLQRQYHSVVPRGGGSSGVFSLSSHDFKSLAAQQPALHLIESILLSDFFDRIIVGFE